MVAPVTMRAPVTIHHEGTKDTKVHEASPPPTQIDCGWWGGFVSFVPFVPSW
jgi:hypothetical protein